MAPAEGYPQPVALPFKFIGQANGFPFPLIGTHEFMQTDGMRGSWNTNKEFENHVNHYWNLTGIHLEFQIHVTDWPEDSYDFAWCENTDYPKGLVEPIDPSED